MAAKVAATNQGRQEADHLFRVICNQLEDLHGEINESLLRQAYELALSAHEGQTRKDGTPYIHHPLEVAEICVQLNMDEESIIAAILHDTVEDTTVRQAQIRQLFGERIAKTVEHLTKIKRIDLFARFTGRNKASMQARNLQRLFVAMTSDMRVILIKLADRLHNMKTLGPMPDHKRQRISRETLEFYIPIARRLGLGAIVGEMEDLVFKHLHPKEYAEVDAQAHVYFKDHEDDARELVKRIELLLKDNSIKAHRIYGRRKHLYSIYQKMVKQGVELDGIYDLLAVRIILDGTEIDCYKVLGLIHSRYKPIFERFRDFIASKKENGYQSLHTTVIGPNGTRIECQIRTIEMDKEASKGVASHWSYKETGSQDLLFKDRAWQEFIQELTTEKVGTEEFVAKTRDALLGDQVLVLSPRGEIVNLPLGSTPVDFAYYIHTDLGHAARRARVNGTTVELNHKLHNGDVVEIFKEESDNPEPKPEFLAIAKSPKSILKLRKYYKARPRQERIQVGRSLLRNHIVKEGLYPLNLTANEKLVLLLKELPVRSIDDLYESVALGNYQCQEIVDKLKKIHRTQVEARPPVPETEADKSATHYSLIDLAAKLGVCLPSGKALRRRTELMRCCTPVPGDLILGDWDRDNRRVRVHRDSCPQLDQPVSDSPLMNLAWLSEGSGMHYPARVRIASLNRVGLLFEVMKYLSTLNINLGGAEFAVSPAAAKADRTAEFELILEVENKIELDFCLEGIRKIGDVISATRVNLVETQDQGDGPSQ